MAMSSRQQSAIARLIRDFLLSLPNLVRTGWGRRGLPPTLQETVAVHSFGVAGLSLFLAILEKSLGTRINPERAAVLGLLHDLQEVETGDLPRPFDEILEELGVKKESVERKARERQEQDLPPPLKKALRDILEEFLRAETPEAQIAKDADNLQAGIMAWRLVAQGFNTHDIVHATRRELRTQSATMVWDWIFLSQPGSNTEPPQLPAP